MKKILIVGYKGFIGSNLYEYLKRNNEVYGIDKNDVLEQLIYRKFDLCINCAGSSDVRRSFETPEYDFELNVTLVERLVEHLKLYNKDIRFINISSAAVYGNPQKLPIKETDRKDPISPYGKHKLISENILRKAFLEDGLKAISLRIFSIYGEGQKKLLFWDLFRKMKSSNKISLFGTGNESRDFINIYDFCRLLDIIVEKGNFDGSAINIASGKEVFVKDAAEIFAKAMGWRGSVCFSNQTIEGYPQNWCADISKIESLGYKAEVDFFEGLKRYISWAGKLNSV